MKLTDIVNAAIKYKKAHGQAAKEVRLNPTDCYNLIPAEQQVFIGEVTLIDPGFMGKLIGLDWYQDPAVPIGEFQII